MMHIINLLFAGVIIWNSTSIFILISQSIWPIPGPHSPTPTWIVFMVIINAIELGAMILATIIINSKL